MHNTSSKALLIALICLIPCTMLISQSFWFGPRVGPTMAFQTWDGSDLQPLFTYHGGIFIETYDPTDEGSGALLAQLNYATRGSAFRLGNIGGSSFTEGFKFNNLSLMLGAKGFLKNMAHKPYYLVGVRVEYNVNNNLVSLEDAGMAINTFLFSDYVNKITYGFTVGGGYNFKISELVESFIEFSVNPDLRNQYQSVPLSGSGGQVIQMREIRNLSLEISAGIRFARKVTYID